MIISMIVAIGENLEIGLDNKLLWQIPEDLKHFKKITTGHTLLMGRKTFESIGKPLPKRTSIILSNTLKMEDQDNCLVRSTINDAISTAKDSGESELFVIGGAQIYKQLLPLVDKLYLSKINYRGKADVFFPQIDFSRWKEVEKKSFPDSSPSWVFHLFERV